MQSVCVPVCSAVLWCVFDTTHNYWVQHWYCCKAVPSFSEHTYDIPLREALWVIFWVRGTLCCTFKGCIHSIGRLPPYWDITKSPIGRSTALSRIGRSFEIGRSKTSVHYTALYRPPHCMHSGGLELTQLTCIRLEGTLIHHRGVYWQPALPRILPLRHCWGLPCVPTDFTRAIAGNGTIEKTGTIQGPRPYNDSATVYSHSKIRKHCLV